MSYRDYKAIITCVKVALSIGIMYYWLGLPGIILALVFWRIVL